MQGCWHKLRAKDATLACDELMNGTWTYYNFHGCFFWNSSQVLVSSVLVAEKTNKNCYSRWKLLKEESQFKCDQCHLLVAQHANLKSHVASVHEGFRRKCSQCDLTFAKTTQVQAHSWVHHRGIFTSALVWLEQVLIQNIDHGKPNTKNYFY